MNHDTIKVEPKAISDLEYYAAKEAAAHHVGELPDPLWPGHVLEEVRATEPDCAAYRADKLRREAAKVLLRDDLDTNPGIDWANTEIAQIEPRKAPRIPRDTEPCHLWEFIAFGAGGMAVLVGLLWLAGWSFSKLLEVLP